MQLALGLPEVLCTPGDYVSVIGVKVTAGIIVRPQGLRQVNLYITVTEM